MAADPVCQTYFGLDADDFGHLTHELVRGLSRLGLEKDMARAVREVSGYRNLRRDRLVWRQASMAAYCVNAFVDWLGFNPATTSETRRTIQLAGRTRTLFGQQPDPEGYPALAAEPLALCIRQVLTPTGWRLSSISLKATPILKTGKPSIPNKTPALVSFSTT